MVAVGRQVPLPACHMHQVAYRRAVAVSAHSLAACALEWVPWQGLHWNNDSMNLSMVPL